MSGSNGQIQNPPGKIFVPSSFALDAMIARAMAACDADVEQAKLAREAKRERDAERAWVHEVTVRARRARWGV